MAPPQALKVYLNRLSTNGKPWSTVDKTWEKVMTCKDRTLGRDFDNARPSTMLDDKLMARLKLIVLDKTGPNRGRSNLATPKKIQDLSVPAESVSKGAGKGRGKSIASKGRGKGTGNIINLEIA